MDLIGTMLVGPHEEGLERAMESFYRAGCETVHVMVDTLDMPSWILLNRYGDKCKIFYREWVYEFGPAREQLQSTIPATVRWQLWLDTDDEIPQDSADRIKEIVHGTDSNGPHIPAIFSMPYIYVVEGNMTRALYRLRMFPPQGVHWHLRAHEYPSFSNGLPSGSRGDIPILHHYNGNEPGRGEKYVEALLKDYQERPNDSRVRHYLAQSLYMVGRLDEALTMYESYLAAGGWQEERMKACIKLSEGYQHKGDLDKALEFGKQAMNECPNRREAYQRVAEVHSSRSEWQEAYDLLAQEVKIPYPQNAQLYVCADHYKERPFVWMAMPCDKLGRYSDGIEAMKQILAFDPNNQMARNNLVAFQAKAVKAYVFTGVAKQRENTQPNAYFYVGPSCESWTAESVNGTGIGGRETSNVHMALEMQKLGWNVVLIPDCKDMEGVHNELEHIHYDKFFDLCREYPPDVVFSSFRTQIVDYDFPAKLKILWSHDMGYGRSLQEWPDFLSSQRITKFDLFFFMSQHQMDYIVPTYSVPLEKSYLTRSGIKVDRFKREGVERNRHRLIYSSSADRGLERLLDFWPEIQNEVPDAELHIFYGFLNAISTARARSEEQGQRMEAWVNGLIAKMEALPGVEYHDRIPQDKLAIEFMKSSIWIYPTHFQETMCLSVLEASAAGCVPVTTKLGALKTTLGDYGTLVDADPDSDEYRKIFIAEIIKLLTDDDYWAQRSELAQENIYGRLNEFGTRFWDWQAIAEEWDKYLREKLGDRQPLPQLVVRSQTAGEDLAVSLSNSGQVGEAISVLRDQYERDGAGSIICVESEASVPKALLRSTLAKAGYQVTKVKIHADTLVGVGQKPELSIDQVCKRAEEIFGVDVNYPNVLESELVKDAWVMRPPEDPTMAIILIACNQKETRTVHSLNRLLKNYESQYELIGVDDGSSDGTLDLFLKHTNIAVRLPSRQGIAAAYTAGLSVSSAPIVCLVQNDADLADGILEVMMRNLQQKSDLGLISASFEDEVYKGMTEDGLIMISPEIKDRDAWATSTVAGACMMFRRSDMEKAWLFDPHLYNAWIEHDATLAFAECEYKIAVVKEPASRWFSKDRNILGDRSAYSQEERARRFLSIYYFHLKWNYLLDLATLETTII